MDDKYLMVILGSSLDPSEIIKFKKSLPENAKLLHESDGTNRVIEDIINHMQQLGYYEWEKNHDKNNGKIWDSYIRTNKNIQNTLKNRVSIYVNDKFGSEYLNCFLGNTGSSINFISDELVLKIHYKTYSISNTYFETDEFRGSILDMLKKHYNLTRTNSMTILENKIQSSEKTKNAILYKKSFWNKKTIMATYLGITLEHPGMGCSFGIKIEKVNF